MLWIVKELAGWEVSSITPVSLMEKLFDHTEYFTKTTKQER